MSDAWSGGSTRRWRKLRAYVLLRDGYVCQAPTHPETPRHLATQLRKDCTKTATQVHHLDGREAGLICPPDRLISSCESCNLTLGDPTRFSPPLGARTPAVPVLSLSPQPQNAPLEPRSELIWSPETLAQFEWLTPYLEPPEDAAPPLYMTPPHPDAAGSYGADAIEWIESSQKITLRWWQRLAIVMQLQHRGDGTLCIRTVLESAPRRAGKSVRVRGVALWRMAHPDLFGEVQTVVHTGSDVAICREIQRGAWRWAEDVANWTVARANGKEAVESETGDRWLVRSQNAVYGWDVCLGIVDEAWDVKPDTFTEGLEPATLERLSPQLHVTSTAHRRATSLMPSLLRAALTMEEPETLLILWAALPGADPGDPDVWRAASPHWSEDRRRMITAKYARALAGEADPEADDPDPMEGFKAQYLNIWRLKKSGNDRGDALVSADDWAELELAAPDRAPDAVAMESWFGDGISVSLAWRTDDGRVVVRSTDCPDLAAAAAVVRQSGHGRRVVRAGESLLDDPALRGLKLRKSSDRAAAAVLELSRLIREDGFAHDGGELLTGQALAARTMPGADGPRMVSTGRFDAIKTAVWAATAARQKPRSGRRIIVASA
jgi:hypothetical protein